MAAIVIDAGHGGSDPGAVYDGRQEKDDNLRLAKAVGKILEDNGQKVIYTRTDDVYQTPFQKATAGNEAGGDYFVSLHRNSSPIANQYEGVETLVYDNNGVKSDMAQNINSELEQLGFRNIGVKERPGLVVLKRTDMPAVLVETGFINNDKDNQLFEQEFNGIAKAIANGILQTIQDSTTSQETIDEPVIYRIQTGAFEKSENAEELLYKLQQQGFPAYIQWDDGYYKVQVGNFGQLDNAAKLESVLRRCGYNTLITG